MRNGSRHLLGVPLASAFLSLLLTGGCAMINRSLSSEPEPLRVGITPDYPPLVYQIGPNVAGLEIDCAEVMGAALGRSVEYVPLRFDELIPALNRGEIDIIMSGLSITEARQIRVAFTEPYLRNGLLGMVRASDEDRFRNGDDIRQMSGSIGVIRGTTADAFVQANCPNARRVVVADSDQALYELRRRRVDLYLDDGHAIVWLVSQNEGDVVGIWDPLTEERLAWAVRRSDTELLRQINDVLLRWRSDGTLSRLIRHRMQYAERVMLPDEEPATEGF